MNFSFVVCFFPFRRGSILQHMTLVFPVSSGIIERSSMVSSSASSSIMMNRKSGKHRREALVQLRKNGDRPQGCPFVYPAFNHLIIVLARCRPARLLHRTWGLAETSQKNEFCPISKRQVGKSILVCTGRHLYGKITFPDLC